MPQKHLVIGLGGTGLKMVRALRVAVAEEIKSRVIVDNLTGVKTVEYYSVNSGGREYVYPDFDIRYLEIDSSPVDLKTHFIGRNEQIDKELILGDANQINIQSDGEFGTAQIRATGAMFFRQKVTEFDTKIRNLVAALGGDGVNIHVCAGLSGGTGAGSVVDVVCRLRQLFPNHVCGGDNPDLSTSPIRISLYLQLPMQYPRYGHARRYFHVNGYATLRELSALNCRQWRPRDLSRPEQPYFVFDVGNGHDGLLGRIFDTACVLDVGALQSGASPAEPTHDGVAQTVGQFLFQKIFVLPMQMEWVGADFFRVDRSEGFAFYTPTDTGVAQCQESSAYACCFSNVGFKRLYVPVEEIKTHFAAVLAREGILQLLYNKASAAGYSDIRFEFPQDFTPEQRAAAAKEAKDYRVAELRKTIDSDKAWFCLSDEYLLWENGFPGDRDCINISERWEEVRIHIDTILADMSLDWRERFELYRARMNDIYMDAYDSRDNCQKGVEEYYSAHSVREKALRAENHLLAIQRALIERFITAINVNWDTIGLQQMVDLGEALSLYLSDGLPQYIDRKINEWAVRKEKYEKDLRVREAGIPKLGFFSNKRKALQVYADCLQRTYHAKTMHRAWQYAAEYVKELASAVFAWNERLDAIRRTFILALDGNPLMEEPGINRIIEYTCPRTDDWETAISTRAAVKLYDTETIVAVEERYRSEALRGIFIMRLRRAINERISDYSHRVFELDALLLATSIFAEGFTNFVLAEARKALDEDEVLRRALPDFNINRWIAKNIPDQERLGESLDWTSGYSAALDADEMRRDVRPGRPIPGDVFCAFLYPETSKEAIGPLLDFMQRRMPACPLAGDRDTEIVILRLRSMLPARAFRRVAQELRQGYLDALQEDPYGRYFHSQTGVSELIPELVLPTDKEIGDLLRGDTRGVGDDGTGRRAVVIGELFDHATYGNLRKAWLMGLIRDDGHGNWSLLNLWNPKGSREEDGGTTLIAKTQGEDIFSDLEMRRFVDWLILQFPANREPYTRAFWFNVMRKINEEWGDLLSTSPKEEVRQQVDREQVRARLEQVREELDYRYPNRTHPEWRDLARVYDFYNAIFRKFGF